jgi:leucyl aminopeptidase
MLKCSGHYGTPERIEADMHVVLFIDDDALFKRIAETLCAPLKDMVLNLRTSGDFAGKDEETIPLLAGTTKYILCGLGAKGGISLESIRRSSARALKTAAGYAANCVAIYCIPTDILKRTIHVSFEDAIQAQVEGALLGAYKFDKYITKKEDDKKGQIKELKVIASEEGFQGTLKHVVESTVAIVEGVELARNLTNAPSNELTPDQLVKEANAVAKRYGLKTMMFGKKEIEAHKMGGLLAVNQGSRKEPRFIILEYNDTKKRLPLFVLVGKGITFDSGGISIKPAAGMEDMKMDMAGAAAVLGTMLVAAKLKIPVRLVALIPATDNMPGGNALCPGDIIRMSNGKTVEVVNTDAEGRLVLADALVYAQRYRPAGIIDLATLTGACVVALASHATGMMGTSDELMTMLKSAGERCSERLWELPLFAEYEKMMKSEVADIKNAGSRWGGAITAAAFLKQFIGETPWVHLDIAGTAMLDEATDYCPKGGSGVGVRLLTEFLLSYETE